jgi:hypothetical protein
VSNEPKVYQICIRGHLTDRWRDWFDEMTYECRSDGTTRLYGVLDQSALHGVLAKIRDLGLELIFVWRLAEPPGVRRGDQEIQTDDGG